jgi:hypothetical protein
LFPINALRVRLIQIDEISNRFESSAPAMQILAKKVALMTKKLEGLLQR